MSYNMGKSVFLETIGFGCSLKRIIFLLKKMILVFDIIVQPPEHKFQIEIHFSMSFNFLFSS